MISGLQGKNSTSELLLLEKPQITKNDTSEQIKEKEKAAEKINNNLS